MTKVRRIQRELGKVSNPAYNVGSFLSFQFRDSVLHNPFWGWPSMCLFSKYPEWHSPTDSSRGVSWTGARGTLASILPGGVQAPGVFFRERRFWEREEYLCCFVKGRRKAKT